MLINRRLFWSRVFAGGLLVYILTAKGAFLPPTLLEHDFAHEMLSLLLVIAGAVGRAWAGLYLGGRKNAVLMQEGPYSLCRHPLYFFSALGALGIAIQSHRLLIVLAVLLFFLLVYPRTVRAEERRLAREFGEAFRKYRDGTPAYFPRLSLYRDAGEIVVYPRQAFKVLLNVPSWILAWYLLGGIEKLQLLGRLNPVLDLP